MKQFKNHEQKRTFIEDFLKAPLHGLGFQCAYLELQLQKFPKLLVAIERFDSTNSTPISIDDCVQVSRTLDTLLDESVEIQELFPDSYTLEVTSPGVERPLSRKADYDRFVGKKAKVQLFRPLQEKESASPDWHKKHAKQKTFLVFLKGTENGNARFETTESDATEIVVPLELISKAHLIPDTDALEHLLSSHSKKERHQP